MEQSDILVYNNNIIKSHEWASLGYMDTLHGIVLRDYNVDYGFSREVLALDVDSYEAHLPGPNDNTMDAIIGIANVNRNNEPRNCRLLLIEFRMGYEKAQNCTHAQMLSKVNHTRDLLIGAQMEKNVYFIFNENVAPQKEREIFARSRQNHALTYWKIRTPSQLQNEISFLEQLPYKPITDVESILCSAETEVKKRNIDNYIVLCQEILDILNSYYIRYNRNECIEILRCWDKVLSCCPSFDTVTEEQQLDIEIIKDDIESIRVFFTNNKMI